MLGKLRGIDLVKRMMCQLQEGFTREEEPVAVVEIILKGDGEDIQMRTHLHGLPCVGMH